MIISKDTEKAFNKNVSMGGDYLSKLGIQDFFNFLESIFENSVAIMMIGDILRSSPPSLEANEGCPQ